MRGLDGIDDGAGELIGRGPASRGKSQDHALIWTQPCRCSLAYNIPLFDDHAAIWFKNFRLRLAGYPKEDARNTLVAELKVCVILCAIVLLDRSRWLACVHRGRWKPADRTEQ